MYHDVIHPYDTVEDATDALVVDIEGYLRAYRRKKTAKRFARFVLDGLAVAGASQWGITAPES